MQKLIEYAHAGLPIVISGGVPFNLSGYNASGSAYVKTALTSITDLENVHQVPSANLSASLQSLGFVPRTKVVADRIWYTYWREDTKASKTYVFVYNDAWDSAFGLASSNGSVTFETTGVPYVYDAWTGDTAAILGYQQTDKTTTIPLTLAGNQSTIIGFHHGESVPCASHPYSFPSSVYGATAKGGDKIWIKSGHQSHPISLANGMTYAPPSAPAALNLTSWTLIVESWGPPEDIYADQTQSAKSNSTFTLAALEPWNAISDSLFNVSGRGFYNSSFTWPPASGHADGAMIDLGAVSNTARVWVNGHQLPPLDPTHAEADVSKFLVNRENKVEVVVATTLGNAVRPLWSQMRSSGTLAVSGPIPAAQAYGLVSDVLVKPYVGVTIDV